MARSRATTAKHNKIQINVINKIKKNKTRHGKRPKSQKKRKEAAQLANSADQKQSEPQTATHETEIVVIDSDSEDSNTQNTKQNAPLTKNDLRTLKPRTWLNDAVIDASLSLLKKKYDPDDRTYISSSFFYSRLKRARSNEEGYYQKTKTWFKNVDLFEKKIWLVPVCDRHHWFLVAVINPGKKNSSILVLNSMKTNTSQVAITIRNFLVKKYAKEKNQRMRLPKIEMPSVPQQKNTFDCGLHVLRFTEAILTHKKPLLVTTMFSLGEMDQFWDDTPLPKRGKLVKQLLSESIPK